MPEPKDDEEKKKTYSWSFSGTNVNCCESTTSTCNVSKLWEVASVTQFHDAALQKATKQINGILEEARRTNRDSSRKLHFIQIEDRHFLAWVHSDLIGSENDDEVIRKALRLKPEKQEKQRQSPARPSRARKARGGVA